MADITSGIRTSLLTVLSRYSLETSFYCPQTKLREGKVLTHVSQSVILFTGGRGSLYDFISCLAAWSHVSSGVLCVWSHVPSRGVSVQGVSPNRDPIIALIETPWTETLLNRDPWTETPLYSKEQAVLILLECILVKM